MRAETSTAAEPTASPAETFRATLRRMPGMIAVWLGFGVLLGFVSPAGTGPIGVAAGATAGVIVLTPMGVMLALLGGRWRETLAGGLLGLLIVPHVASVPGLTPRLMNAFGLIFGGIVGATAVTALYRFPRLLWSVARPAVQARSA